MNQLSFTGLLSSLPEQQVVQPIESPARRFLGPGLEKYLHDRGVETRKRYINALRKGPLNRKQISAAIGIACVRGTLLQMEKEGYVCDAFPGQKRKKQLKLWKWTGKGVQDE